VSQVRSVAAGGSGQFRPAVGEPRPPLGLTPRGAVLLLVMFALAATAVYPLRQYVSQQHRIEFLEAKQRALAPSCSSMRSSWLYLAVRSDRARLPVLIWPQRSATARSAMVESSVSPDRCDITAV
jgi:hypothetical protein